MVPIAIGTGSSPGGGAKAIRFFLVAFLIYRMSSVYIIYSNSSDSFYTGFTTESVVARVEKHNNNYYYNILLHLTGVRYFQKQNNSIEIK